MSARKPHSAIVLLVLALVATPAHAYIHFPPPTMQKMCMQSSNVRILQVTKFDKEKGVIVYEIVETLKGQNLPKVSYRHAIRTDPDKAKPIFDWVAEGKQAVMFSIEGGNILCGFVFIDEFCYSVDYNHGGDYWLLIRVDPEMAACYYGSVEQLQQVTKDILAGKEVKVPVKASVETLPPKEREKRVPALNEIIIKNRGQ